MDSHSSSLPLIHQVRGARALTGSTGGCWESPSTFSLLLPLAGLVGSPHAPRASPVRAVLLPDCVEAHGMLWPHAAAWVLDCAPSLALRSAHRHTVWGAHRSQGYEQLRPGCPCRQTQLYNQWSSLAAAPGPRRGKKVWRGNGNAGPTSAHSKEREPKARDPFA